MTALRHRMIDDMRIRNLSPRTIKSYVYKVRKFAKYFNRSPEDLGPEDIRTYLLFLINKGYSRGSITQSVCALRFLYKVTLRRDWQDQCLPYPKKGRQLPVVLSRTEVPVFLDAVDRPKQRVFLLTLYSTGLRLGEGRNLLPEDIDSKRMVIRVRGGKGNKDRYIPLARKLLTELRRHWVQTKPKIWLFEGRRPGRPLCEDSVQKACGRACAKAGISKHVTPHTLRRAFPYCTTFHKLFRRLAVPVGQVQFAKACGLASPRLPVAGLPSDAGHHD